MNDTKILDEVYRKLEFAVGGDAVAIRRFIELEWQKRDEEEVRKEYNRNRPVEEHIHYPETVPSFSKHWYTDVRDMERHRGLEIGPDGTVNGIT
tara:strand:- start:587 stop:868 length:282 start_codon:yes stop_codon:yes gene_type:complete